MNTLVQLTTQDISKATPVASTRIIAKEFNKRHSDVVRVVNSFIRNDSVEFFSVRKVTQRDYTDSRGKTYQEYLLDRDQFMFIVMSFNGKKANLIKVAFIKQFNFMEHELFARSETRSIGKMVRHSLTDSINQNLQDNTNHKRFAFGNYTKLVYKKVLGSTVKKIKEDRGLKTTDNIRNHLTSVELEEVQAMESKIAVLVEGFTSVMTDKETYAKVKELI